MKIGILIMHALYSYEHAMQAYILQEFLREKGHSTEIIDYRPAFLTERNEKFKGDTVKRKKSYEAFLRERLQLSETIQNKQEACCLKGRYDFILSAGPGVFDGAVSGGLKPVYFACFDKTTPKAACAISIRENLVAGYEEEFVSRYLEAYNRVAACDEKIAERLQHFSKCNVGIQRSLFLLGTNEQYAKMAGEVKESSLRRKPYIFMVALDNEKSVRKTMVQLRSMTGLGIVHNFAGSKTKKQIKQIAEKNPMQMIAYAYNAEYIVTSSVDMAMLGVMFEKKLLLVARGSDRNRMLAFAEAYGLENSLLETKDDFKEIEQTKPDYSVVREKVAEDRKQMVDSLMQMLQTAESQ